MPHVLYVDDEPALCKAFSRALRGAKIEVFTTTDAYEAIRILGTSTFDVVASDLRMPTLDGIHVLRAARHHDPCARRLLVSGEAETELGQSVRDEGIDAILSKPWSLDQLRDTVTRACAAAALTRENVGLERLVTMRTAAARETFRRLLMGRDNELAERCGDLEWDALIAEINARY